MMLCDMSNEKFFFKNILALAYGAISRARGRTVLTMLAIAIGIGSVITISAAGAGMKRFVLAQLDSFSPDGIYIETRVPSNKKGDNDFGAVGITITTLKDDDIKAVASYPGMLAAHGMVTGQELVAYQGQIKKVMLNGRGASMPEIEKIELSEGRFFEPSEEESLATVAVLGSKVKSYFFGDDTAVGKTISIRGKSFRVVGAIKERGAAFFLDNDNMIYIPTKTMQKKLLGINYLQAISARLKSGVDPKVAAVDLAEILRANHEITDPAKDDFAVRTTADAAATLTTVTGGLTLLLIALVCISLAVGGVGIMNIMYVSVAERTFEIGLRKAVGATKKVVLYQFLAEAVLITLGGGVIGIVGGAIMAGIIYLAATSFGFKWVYSVTLTSIFLSVGFSALIGLMFGLYPARKAAELSPIDALRKE